MFDSEFKPRALLTFVEGYPSLNYFDAAGKKRMSLWDSKLTGPGVFFGNEQGAQAGIVVTPGEPPSMAVTGKTGGPGKALRAE